MNCFRIPETIELNRICLPEDMWVCDLYADVHCELNFCLDSANQTRKVGGKKFSFSW